ncbi:PREDICTED: protein SRG1-like [Ipomoea nil]|uniref:protein SRG1-like n=1 Tax=Ipomoea nil TaxID=35883 RepID=UPI000901DF90|nr:PREDICTED: protein SRG1-like [Ipomoea nil]
MEADAQTLGLSLPVPSVQQLVKDNPNVVPRRYIRDGVESPASEKSIATVNVPVIDMQKLLSEDSEEFQKLHLACKDWGFFHLINHGVNCSLVEEVKRGIQGFFNLPLEEKQRYGQAEGDTDGFGQLFVVSEEQKLDWADMFYLKTLPTNIRSPNLFPKLPEAFRNTIETYSVEMHKLSMKVLCYLAKNLGIKQEEMRMLFEEGMQSMRMNYYPPCPESEHVMGLSPHSDAGGLTILLQVNETTGLEIKKDGTWFPILPIPNAFVVNVGDCVEIFSNGIYRSIEHRALVSPNKVRISIATFQSPRLDGELGPSTSLINTQNSAKFKRISVPDFFRLFFGRKLDGKSHVDVLRIANK